MTCNIAKVLKKARLLPLVAALLYALPADTEPGTGAPPAAKETLHYGVEWRLIRAGTAKITWMPLANSYQGDLDVASAGIVSKLYKVNDHYSTQLSEDLCAKTVYLRAQEGKRNRETRVTFDPGGGKISYLERDLNKNETVLAKELERSECTFEYVGGLFKLRASKIEIGQSTQVPMSDGKKFAMVKVEAQEREQVKTPTGTYNAIRYEVHMMNQVLVNKKGRLFVWITDDERRLPVQIRVRMQFLIGTITLQLEKIDTA